MPERKNPKSLQGLWNRNFTALMAARMSSMLGGTIQSQFILLWVTYSYSSATRISLVTSIPSFISLIFIIFGGAYADRNSRKTILIKAYALNALVVGAGASVLYLNGSHDLEVTFWIVVLISSLLSVVSSYGIPASEALLITVAPNAQLAKARSVSTISRSASKIFGEGISGYIFSSANLIAVFIMNGIALLAAFFAVTSVKPPGDDAPKATERKPSFLSDVLFGFSYIRQHASIYWLIVLAIGLNSTWAIVETYYAYFLKTVLGSSAQLYSMHRALVTFTGLLGVSVAPIVVSQWPRLQFRFFVFFSLFAQTLFALLLYLESIYSAMAIFGLISFALGIQQIVLWNSLQKRLANSILGRIHGIWSFLVGVLSPMMVLMTSFVLERMNVSISSVFWLIAIMQPILTLTVAWTTPLAKIFKESTDEVV